MPCWREEGPTSWPPPYDLGPRAELTITHDRISRARLAARRKGEPHGVTQPVTEQGAAAQPRRPPPAPSLAMSTAARATVRNSARAPLERRFGWRAADPPQRPVLLVNPKSVARQGRAPASRVARDRGIDVVDVRPDATSQRWSQTPWRAAPRVGVAGGDGSSPSWRPLARAELLSGSPPARSHFALDLGIDRHDLVGSLDAFTDGVERRIDVAEVNGRLFLNNVSLGIYGDAVRQPTYRDAKADAAGDGSGSPRTGASATELQLVDNQGHPHRNSAVVLVSNNPYSLEPPHAPGTRPSLDSGQLGVVVLDTPRAGRSRDGPGPPCDSS